MAEILHQLIGSLSHYLQGLIHPRWCRISSINSMTADLLIGQNSILHQLIGWSWCQVQLRKLQQQGDRHPCVGCDPKARKKAPSNVKLHGRSYVELRNSSGISTYEKICYIDIYIYIFDDLSMYVFVLRQKNIISTSTLKEIIAVCKKKQACNLSTVICDTQRKYASYELPRFRGVSEYFVSTNLREKNSLKCSCWFISVFPFKKKQPQISLSKETTVVRPPDTELADMAEAQAEAGIISMPRKPIPLSSNLSSVNKPVEAGVGLAYRWSRKPFSVGCAHGSLGSVYS